MDKVKETNNVKHSGEGWGKGTFLEVTSPVPVAMRNSTRPFVSCPLSHFLQVFLLAEPNCDPKGQNSHDAVHNVGLPETEQGGGWEVDVEEKGSTWI